MGILDQERSSLLSSMQMADIEYLMDVMPNRPEQRLGVQQLTNPRTGLLEIYPLDYGQAGFRLLGRTRHMPLDRSSVMYLHPDLMGLMNRSNTQGWLGDLARETVRHELGHAGAYAVTKEPYGINRWEEARQRVVDQSLRSSNDNFRAIKSLLKVDDPRVFMDAVIKATQDDDLSGMKDLGTVDRIKAERLIRKYKNIDEKTRKLLDERANRDKPGFFSRLLEKLF